MALHGLSEITLGVPNVEAVVPFYEDFGLSSGAAGMSTPDGGVQMKLVQRPHRQIVELVIGCDEIDDVNKVRQAAERRGGLQLTDDGDGIGVMEPNLRLLVRVAVRDRIVQKPTVLEPMNAPGSIERPNARPATLFAEQPVRPRRLGHVAFGSPDMEGSSEFFREIIGLKLSDSSPGVIEFLRCSPDHHNVALVGAPVPFLHHTSWQMDSFDAIGHAATRMLAVDPARHVWGLGRHFLGSNLFWYLRDPAGNFAEYHADLDQIVDDAEWLARTWDPDKAFYIWGPPPPPEMMRPSDLDDIVAALAG